MASIRFVVVSGLSGSGKSIAIKAFEDIGFFCVDNLPSALIPKFAELCSQTSRDIKKVALGIDIRERDFLPSFLSEFKKLSENYQAELIFFEAKDEVLIRRFSETRRKHPLAEGISVIDGIKLEKEKLAPIREQADKIIDTSEYTLHQLRDVISSYFYETDKKKKMNVSIVTFGYKYGIPYNSDLVFDVRFLPNPYFIERLKDFSGLDKSVRDYIMELKITKKFLKIFLEFIKFIIPLYEYEGKAYLTLALGCTGGRHRSVTLGEELSEYIKKLGYSVTVTHRDIEKEHEEANVG